MIEATAPREDFSIEKQALLSEVQTSGSLAYNHLRRNNPVRLGPLFGFPADDSVPIPSRVVGGMDQLLPHFLRQAIKSDEVLDEELVSLDPDAPTDVSAREQLHAIARGMLREAKAGGDDFNQVMIEGVMPFLAADPTDNPEMLELSGELLDLIQAPRPKERLKATEVDRVIGDLRYRLDAINLTSVTVRSEVSERSATEWDKRLTLGLTSTQEAWAGVVASADKPTRTEMPIDVLLIPDGHLRVDHLTGRPVADLFFRRAKNSIVPIKPDVPVPLDLVDMSMTEHFGVKGVDQRFIHGDMITADILCSKEKARVVMEDVGVSMPDGLILSERDSVSMRLQEFLSQHDDIQGIVVKDPLKHRSEGVRMFRADGTGFAQAVNYAEKIQKSGGVVVIEERIIPMQLPFQHTEEMLDWNVRSVLSFTDGQPAYLGSLIRFAPISDNPVSLSAGGYGQLIPERSNLDGVMRDFSVAVGAKLDQGITNLGGDPQGIFGLDIMVGKTPEGKARPVILETNGWNVGGIEELCRLRMDTLPTITTKFLPGLEKRLKANHDLRSMDPS